MLECCCMTRFTVGRGTPVTKDTIGHEQAQGMAMQARKYPTLGEATRVWARIGMLSFGGPAGQIALMHRILVEEQKWLGEKAMLR